MSDTVATGTYRGRLGSYSMTVTGPTGALTALGKVVATDLAFLEPPQITHGTMQPSFGGGILPLEMVLRLVDSGNLIQRLRDLYPSERDVVLTLSGANGRGDTAYWEGSIARATPAQSLSPRVYPLKTIEVEVRCGLAATQDVAAPASENVPWGFALYRAVDPGYGTEGASDPIPLFLAASIRPAAPAIDGGTTYGSERTRFVGSVSGSSTVGDNGDAIDLIESLARTFSLSIFHPILRPALSSVAASGEDRIFAVTRSRVGTAIVARGYDDAATSWATTTAADTLELGAADWEADAEGNDRLPQLGSIVFEPTPGAEGGVASASGPTLGSLLTGETASQVLMSLSPSADIDLRVEASFTGYLDTQPDPDETIYPGSLRVTSTDGDGTVYYGSASGWATGVTTHSPDASGLISVDIPIDSLPGATVGVTVIGETDTVEPSPGVPDVDVYANAHWIRLSLVDDTTGDPVVDFLAREGTAGWGETSVTCPLMPPAEVYSSSTWAEVTEWESDVTGEDHDLLQVATAAERFAQQGQRLRVLTLTIIGALVGPGTRLRFKPTSEDSASPFSTEVYAVIVGASPDLSTGNTRAVVVDAAEDGLT